MALYPSGNHLPESALSYLDETLLFANQLNERSGIGVILGNIRLVYLEMGNLDEAGTAFGEALAIQWELKHPVKSAVALINLARGHIVCDDVKTAAGYLFEAPWPVQ